MQRDLSDGLELWRTDGTRFGALRGLHPTTTVTLSRDGRFLMMPVSGGVEVAELDTLRPPLILAGHRARPGFDTLPGHDRLLSCDGAGMAVLWDRERPAPIRHLGFPGCEGLAFARDGARFIAGRTVFEGDGVASMTLSSAKATALALDGAEVHVLDIVEGPTFEERRIVARWELANNILPMHVPTEGPDAGWLIPADSALQLHAGSSMKTASMQARAGGGAVAAVPLDTTRWLVGMCDGAIHVVEFEPR